MAFLKKALKFGALALILGTFWSAHSAFAFINAHGYTTPSAVNPNNLDFSSGGSLLSTAGTNTCPSNNLLFGWKRYNGQYPDNDDTAASNSDQLTGNVFSGANWSDYSNINISNLGLPDGNYWFKFRNANLDSNCNTTLIGDYVYFNFHITDGIPMPETSACTTNCFSNVLFLPGLEGSRLYKQNGGNEDQLWEPNVNSDVEDLYLNNDGTSINPNVYTRDIIKETNTPIPTGVLGKNIYKSFSNTMDGLVSDHKIKEWQAFAYDWRQSPDDVVNTAQNYGNGTTLSLVPLLQALEQSSNNGKVTIIAHSNGGLVAKALLKRLQDDKAEGVNNLIDNIDVLILAAVPEIGTAKAVPAIMHGYDEQILGGWLMDNVRARELGRNMPSAYGALPSKEYINHISASPVTFKESLLSENLFQFFGSAINSYDEYKSFLFGNEGRTNPPPSLINLPINLSQTLFSKAENLHNNIDNFIPPPTLRTIEVAGWGVDTLVSFEYDTKHIACPQVGFSCDPNSLILDEIPRFTSNGDGAVVVPSAQYMGFLGNAEKYWLNLTNTSNDHSTVLELPQLLDFISNTMKKDPIMLDNVLKNTEPLDASNRFRISIHSPATLDAYDSSGNHTGKICPPTSDFCYAEENITNSSYLEFGEGKYINLPEDQFSKIKLQGTATGTFTYESERVLPDNSSTTTSFKDIPVTASTKAEITKDSTTNNLKLSLDKNGDGIVDITLQAALGSVATLPTYTFSGFLQPINDTAHQVGQSASVFKAGSTVPVKFQLKKTDGTLTQASALPVWLNPQKGTAMSSAVDESIYTDTATSGTTFKWDATSQQYIYNWSTKGLTPGYWYKISVKLDDGNTYLVNVGLK